MENKQTKENRFFDFIKKAMIIVGVLGVIGAAIGAFIKYGADQQHLKEITFEDSEQRHDVVDLLDIEFHPLKLSKTQDTLMRQIDLTVNQQKKLDTLLTKTYNQKERDAIEKHFQDSIENIRAIEVQKNREKRNRIQEDILDELILIKVEQRKINIRLDSIKPY